MPTDAFQCVMLCGGVDKERTAVAVPDGKVAVWHGLE